MNSPDIAWPDLVRAFRTTRGLKQEAAATQFGVSQATWSRWEDGVITPNIEMRNKLFRGLRRERSPIDARNWLAVFRQWLCPASVLTGSLYLRAVSQALAEGCQIARERMEGVPTAELFSGEAFSIRQGSAEHGLFEGRVASVEACYYVEVSPQIAKNRSFYFHAIGWPHFDDTGEILFVSQGAFLTHAEARPIRARLGGAVNFVPAY